MAAASGPNIVEEGLAFAYDMGSKQSWKGKPGTNIAYHNETKRWSLSNLTTTGLTLTSAPQLGNEHYIISCTTGGQFRMYFDVSQLVNGSTYCISFKYKLLNASTFAVTDWCDTSLSNTVYTDLGNYKTVSANGTRGTYDSTYRFLDLSMSSTGDSVEIWDVVLQEGVTPSNEWFSGTRSNTEAIIDWKGNNTISPADLVYTNDNKFTFNGLGETDGSPLGSYIPLPTSATTTEPSTKPNGVTYDIWLKADTDAPDRMGLLVGSGTINHIEIYSSSKYFRTEAVTENGYSFGAGGFPDSCRGVWSNFSIVFANDETNRPVRWYQNGKLFYTHTNMGSGTDVNQYFLPSRLGSATGSGTYLYAESFKGEIPSFKVYDRSLSENEVKQNFNALRGRFGI